MNARMPHMAGYSPTLNLSNVVDAQRAINILRDSGFLHRESVPKPLAEDGNLGPYTRAALTAFQQATYLPATGRLDASTRGMLAQALGSLGVRAEANAPRSAVGGIPIMNIGNVADVQTALNMLNPAGQLPQDGMLGDKTRQALIDFQKAYMLPATGLIDKPTRSTIAQALVRIGIPAYVPAASTGALQSADEKPDRAAQIKWQALSALHELREIGLTAVADSLRHLLSEPTLDNLRRSVAFLALPTSGSFANQVASMWAPVLDGYSKQHDPDAALRANVPAQLSPLLAQTDAVLGAVNQLAANPTVDNLSMTITKLTGPQGGPLGANIAKPLKNFLASITPSGGDHRS